MGEPGNRLPRLCIFSCPVGGVCFTIYFTVPASTGSGRTEDGGFRREKSGRPGRRALSCFRSELPQGANPEGESDR